jgi:hypothetical protein
MRLPAVRAAAHPAGLRLSIVRQSRHGLGLGGTRSRVAAAVRGVRLDDPSAGTGSLTTGSSRRLAHPTWALMTLMNRPPTRRKPTSG